MSNTDLYHISSGDPAPRPGPYLARVISHLDPTYMGMLEVELLRPGGNNPSSGSIHMVSYMSPFYGVTSISYAKEINDYNNTQKSYGMWMVPPDPGTVVVVIFIDGNFKYGYWIGCVQDEFMNFMVPGLAATSQVVDETDRMPTGEYNRKATEGQTVIVSDPEKLKKPRHPLADALEAQGLLKDDIRGITTSSARRETPSMVFGISTPGPLDKRPGAQTGTKGKVDNLIVNAPVSRLGGTTFVMDDGDDKYIRKTSASDGPPEYEAVEQLGEGETPTGDETIPHNELFRIRTRTGHQILLHNSEDLIYIGNARGTTWIELTSDGKIDIYAEDSISLHTKQDLNFYADRDINIEAGRNFNLKVAERHQTEVGADKILIVDNDNFIRVTGVNNTTAGGLFQVKAAGTNIDGGEIHLNSNNFAGNNSEDVPPLTTFANPTENSETTIESIMLRIPSHEPWPHHENLNPIDFKPAMTDREIGSSISIPDSWKEYTTTTDTFQKIKGAG